MLKIRVLYRRSGTTAAAHVCLLGTEHRMISNAYDTREDGIPQSCCESCRVFLIGVA